MSESTNYDKPFWAAAAEHRLQFQACDTCGYVRWPPAGVCPECLSRDWSWRPSRGLGQIWSWVVYHRAYRADLRDALPYNVVLVELDEGVRLISRAVDFGEAEISPGSRVRVDFRDIGGRTVPVFVPAGATPAGG